MPGHPCTVGLTGGLASGKSTAGRLLEADGIPVFDCDSYVHQLYRPDGAGVAAVADLFGESVLAEDRGVDRAALARLVLSDPRSLEQLEAAVHPLVRRGVAEWIEGLRVCPVVPVAAVVEAALLVETGSYRSYDLLAVVWCHAEQQIERAVARGVERERARALLAAQLPLEEKRKLADVIIDNSGARDELGLEVDRAWREISELCRAGRCLK